MAKLSLRAVRPLALAVAVPLVSGCTVVGIIAAAEPGYDAGALSQKKTSRDAVTRVGCLDVGARASPGDGFVLLDLELGNRCNRATPTDLSHLAVKARTATGEVRSAAIYDPDGVIVPLALAPRRLGQETLRLDTPADVTELCLDVSGIAPRAAADDARPLCFSYEQARWREARQ
jgi:hypothetical protein